MKQKLYDLLEELNIEFKHFEHEPLFTAKQAKEVVKALKLPGDGVKNLFLKDNAEKLYLIVALADTVIKLKQVAKDISAPNLRFAKPDLLKETLGVEPGSVTPFGLINDTHKKVQVILDDQLFQQDLLQLHPLVNTETLTISPNDLKKFIDACGNRLRIYTF